MHHTLPVGLIGVTGYTGMELLRLVSLHPNFSLAAATSRQEAGRRIQDIFPQFTSRPEGGLVITPPKPETLARDCRLVFLAVPHGTAMDMAAELLARSVAVVDLSADFRLTSPQVYAQWYGLEHRYPELLAEAAYGLVERNAEAIARSRLVANPGCYPTSALLGLAPALDQGLIQTDGIVIDSKSGTSGAGRGAKTGSLFCEVHDSFRAYSLGRHRHTPEIEQELAGCAGRALTVSFNPHLLPITRGIVSTIYTRLSPGVGPDEVRRAYARAYDPWPWVRVLPEGCLPEARHVRGSMYCDLGLVVDERCNRLIIVSAIDNLCRGASGQAVANANLVCGLEVSSGLEGPPLVP